MSLSTDLKECCIIQPSIIAKRCTEMTRPDLYDVTRWRESFRRNLSYTYPESVTVIRCLTLIAILTAGERDLLDALIGFIDRLAA